MSQARPEKIDRQVAEEPAAESQTRVAGDLDGRNQGRRRTGVHRELHANTRRAADSLSKDRDTLRSTTSWPNTGNTETPADDQSH
jgi:hypothetical protein